MVELERSRRKIDDVPSETRNRLRNPRIYSTLSPVRERFRSPTRFERLARHVVQVSLIPRHGRATIEGKFMKWLLWFASSHAPWIEHRRNAQCLSRLANRAERKCKSFSVRSFPEKPVSGIEIAEPRNLGGIRKERDAIASELLPIESRSRRLMQLVERNAA